MTADALFNSALQHHQSGRLAEAEALYRQVLSADPANADAMQRLAIISHKLGRTDDAISLLRKTVELKPEAADYQNNLGVVLVAVGREDEALAAFLRAIDLGADFPETRNNIGNILRRQGKLDEALEAYRHALRLRPNYPEAHDHLGAALLEAGRIEEAIPELRTAISLRPDFPEAYNNLGNALRGAGDIDAALEAFRKAEQLRPNWAELLNNLGSVLQEMRQLDAAIDCYRRAIAISNESRIWDNLLLAIQIQDFVTPEQIYGEHAKWNRVCAEPLAGIVPARGVDVSDSNRRLRIGYVSPDFCDHAVGRQVLPLIEHRDREQFEVVCYSSVQRADGMTARFRTSTDLWRDVRILSDEQLAEQIRQDEIDILVDLALHSAHNRLLAFARKPAPVQVTFAGYPGTTGLRAIDYRLSDPYLDELPIADCRLPNASGISSFIIPHLSLHSETTVVLPRCFWCLEPRDSDPPVKDPPALTNGFITFGCLSHFSKITNDTLLNCWREVLLRVPNSRLLVLAPRGSVRAQFNNSEFLKGIEPQRIEFADRCPRPRYMELYNRIDICLDTFPYNGHTTTLDALWMGVPLVTRYGDTTVSRGAFSILSNAGLAELAARTPEEFVEIAVSLAENLPRLAELRSMMRDRMRQSPLMDVKRFTRDIESAYLEMWSQRSRQDSNLRPAD